MKYPFGGLSGSTESGMISTGLCVGLGVGLSVGELLGMDVGV